ncbi:hypothetical protein VCHA53O466_140064 [Vibrio chagasii]|nr:hypothetical protein VCHA53O466_140064 [Vibrio chagasii]
MNKSRNGFLLIEVILVVVISIGLLASTYMRIGETMQSASSAKQPNVSMEVESSGCLNGDGSLLGAHKRPSGLVSYDSDC